MSSETGRPEQRSARLDYRTRLRIEFAGVLAVAALALAMLGYLAARTLADSSAAAAAVVDGYLAVGAVVGDAVGMASLAYNFGWYSLATGVLVGVVGPLVGAFVVHREMALIGETLAHTAFAGVAIGLLFSGASTWGVPVLAAALATGILGAFAVQFLAGRTATHGDVPIAIVLTGSFAIGVIAISLGPGLSGANVDAYLFGEMAAVDRSGAQLMAVISVLVVAAVVANYKPFLAITFDEQAARVARLDVTWYNAVLVVLTALVVVGAMQILGIILVTAMLVVPVAAGSALARSFRETLYLSVLLGQVAVLVGAVLAFNVGAAPGGTIVVVLIAIYLVAVAASSRTGAATRVR